MSYIDFNFNLIPYWKNDSNIDVSGNSIELVFDHTKNTDIFDYNTDWVVQSYQSSIGYCAITNYSGSSDYIRKKTLDGSANALNDRYFNLIINPGIDSSNNFYLSYDNTNLNNEFEILELVDISNNGIYGTTYKLDLLSKTVLVRNNILYNINFSNPSGNIIKITVQDNLKNYSYNNTVNLWKNSNINWIFHCKPKSSDVINVPGLPPINTGATIVDVFEQINNNPTATFLQASDNTISINLDDIINSLSDQSLINNYSQIINTSNNQDNSDISNSRKNNIINDLLKSIVKANTDTNGNVAIDSSTIIRVNSNLLPASPATAFLENKNFILISALSSIEGNLNSIKNTKVELNNQAFGDFPNIMIALEINDSIQFTFNGDNILYIKKTSALNYDVIEKNNIVQVRQEFIKYSIIINNINYAYLLGSATLVVSPVSKSVMKKASSGDYIAIKRQKAIFKGKNTNNLVIESDKNCCSKTPQIKDVCKVKTANSYEILNNFYNGQKYNNKFCKK